MDAALREVMEHLMGNGPVDKLGGHVGGQIDAMARCPESPVMRTVRSRNRAGNGKPLDAVHVAGET